MDDQQQRNSRFVVGIDLGTTNTAVSFVDMEHQPHTIGDFPVRQIIAPGETALLPLFPSFHYTPVEVEFTKESLALPWENTALRSYIAGTFARDHGSTVPGRLVSSAKSWLSHAGVDRTAPLLPWHSVADVEKISPVIATSRYLNHIKESWNHTYTDYPLEQQDVIITVPASFDEVARELTVEAAGNAGIKRIILLEEPQAAFYAWIHQHAHDWQNRVKAGQSILICDIGGGTTDFTMIQVRGNDDGSVQFFRIAVGDHLILGGDNIDLALAYYIEKQRLQGTRLSPRQFGALVGISRKAKEILLGDNSPETWTVTIPGTGTSLIGGSIQVELTISEIEKILLDGFFPFTSIDSLPSKRQSGFQEFGLPYASDAAITKYLAAFLVAHRDAVAQNTNNRQGDPSRPDIILFNGGVLSSSKIRERILDVLLSWYSTKEKPWSPCVFENAHPELAVSRGASYYGLVRRGKGIRIHAGLARSYYIGVETVDKGTQACCLVPAGLKEGEHIDLHQRSFELLIRQPVEFPLYVSSKRTTDTPGDLIKPDPLEMYSLPPIRTVLRSGKKLEADTARVMLHVKLTEIGTLDLWCSETDGNRNWKLQFDVRSATQTDLYAHEGLGEAKGVVDTETVEQCKKVIEATFQKYDTATYTPQNLMKHLEVIISTDRIQWPPSLLRSFWETCYEQEKFRFVDPLFEVRWLNLLGFSLRPGYGYAIDDWRIKQTWLLFQRGVAHPRNQACTAEWWILWRRIAGGLSLGQQQALALPLVAVVKSSVRSDNAKKRVKSRSDIRYGVHELSEMWRLLGSLEHLKSEQKVELGALAMQKIVRKGDVLTEAAVWVLGRLGARMPLYGPLNELVSPEIASQWALDLIAKARNGATVHLALMQICRKCNDRYRDIDETTRSTVITFMNDTKAPQHYNDLINEGGILDDEEKNSVFGEQLPTGLKITA